MLRSLLMHALRAAFDRAWPKIEPIICVMPSPDLDPVTTSKKTRNRELIHDRSQKAHHIWLYIIEPYLQEHNEILEAFEYAISQRFKIEIDALPLLYPLWIKTLAMCDGNAREAAWIFIEGVNCNWEDAEGTILEIVDTVEALLKKIQEADTHREYRYAFPYTRKETT